LLPSLLISARTLAMSIITTLRESEVRLEQLSSEYLRHIAQTTAGQESTREKLMALQLARNQLHVYLDKLLDDIDAIDKSECEAWVVMWRKALINDVLGVMSITGCNG
jgi:hypothetical protein